MTIQDYPTVKPASNEDDSSPKVRQDYGVWKSRIDLGKRAIEPFLEEGAKFEKGYQGQIIPQQDKENMQVNLIYVDIKRSVTSMYSKNPKIFFEPDQPAAEQAADILEIAVNQKWHQLKMKQKVREAIKSSKLYGVAGFKTYYYMGDYKDSFNDSIQTDDVRTDFIPLKYLLKDPASTWKTSPWIAHEVIVPIKELKKMFNLPENEEPTVVSSVTKSEKLDPYVRSDFQYGAYYEIEDRVNRQIGYIVRGIDGFVKRKIDKKKWRPIPYNFDSMYDFLSYNDLPNNPEIYADYHFYWMHLVNLCRYRTMQTTHAIRGASKYLVHGAALTEEQQLQLKTYLDTSFVEMQPNQNVVALQHANLDPSILQTEQILRSDIQLLSQLIPSNPNIDKTATQVKVEEMGSQEVTSEAMEILEEVMASIATKWAALMQDNYTATRMINITEMPGAEFIKVKDSLEDRIETTKRGKSYLKFNKEDIAGYKFRGSVKAGSTMPDSDQTRMQKFMGFVKFISSLGLTQALDQEEVVKEGANIFGVENDNILKRKNSPTEENRLLDANVLVPISMSDDDELHLEEHKLASNTAATILHRASHEKQKEDKNRAMQLMQARTSSLSMPDVMSGRSAMQPDIAGAQNLNGPTGAQPQTIQAMPPGPAIGRI